MLVASILLATPACGGNTAVPAAGSNPLPDFVRTASAGGLTDMKSILKKLTKDVEIGSTVDSKNGDTGPRAISLVHSTFGLKKGQLLVCNFEDSAGTAGKGTTIEVFDPKPKSKPRTFVQSSKIEGCVGNAATVANDVYGAGMASGIAAQFNQSSKFQYSYGSPIEEPLDDADASCGLAYAPEDIYVSDAKTGAVIKLAKPPVSSGPATETQVIAGFAVNKGSGWSALGPSGIQYNATRTGSLCNDTLYMVDGVDNTVVAISNASQLLAKNEIVVEPGGKKFKCAYASRTCATLVYSGSPLNAPVAQALLPNGNLIVANGKGGNTLVELTPTGKILATKTIDTNKSADIFGLLAEGTDDSNTVLFYTDTSTNTLQELEQ
ncbi:MAG TPA: hypothetical protein VNU22_04730 [Candidatus Acidoferrum sp.]|nr:hypothetical protein [Candidatus Acidoferrum sp.]